MIADVSKVSAEKPLEGAVLCCTSILPEDRAQLAEYAEEMGAKHTLDLTSNVTHLLVGHTDSKKYQYVAKEREDVKVLLPDWVHALREKWMAAEAIDLNALDAQYRCPTLHGLKICITGFEDLEFRTELSKNIAKNGGLYTGDLTKDVTHLIAFTPQGKKYEHAGPWGIKIVSLKWYKDTLDRGMQLDESLYHPATAPDMQGRGAWNRQPSGGTRLGKRSREDPPPQEPSRKLRRAASARFGSQHNDMWNDIVGRPPSADSVAITSKLRPAQSLPDVGQSFDRDPGHHPEPAKSSRVAQSNENQKEEPQPVSKNLLAGKHFAHKGFNEARKSRLSGVLLGHGATVHQTISDFSQATETGRSSRLLIVPHEIEQGQLASITENLANVTTVTELWLEFCMTVKRFVSPNQYPLGLPICLGTVPAISELTVNASGFHQVQTMHIAKIIKMIDATYSENFTRDTSVLIINSGNLTKQKILYAESWKVPVVTEKWLWELFATCQLPSFDEFAIRTTSPRPESANKETNFNQAADTKMSSSRGGNDGTPEADEEDSFVAAANALRAQAHQVANRAASKEMNVDQKGLRDLVETRLMSRDEVRQPQQIHQPLKEISANIMSKPTTTMKKKLFQHLNTDVIGRVEVQESISNDGGSFARTSYLPRPTSPEPEPVLHVTEPQVAPVGPIDASVFRTFRPEMSKDSDILKEFLEIKAAAEARKSHASSAESKPTKNKLIGRALSNLSNSSHKSNEETPSQHEAGKRAFSRASSINSVNTDGLGVPLSNLSRIPSDLVAKPATDPRRQLPPSLGGNANARLTRVASASLVEESTKHMDAYHDDMSFHAALATLSTSQLPRPPSPSQQDQLTYADTDEAAKLKAHLAEKRRKRARLGQSESDPDPEMSREERERRKAELAREESEEKRQAKWRSDKDRGFVIKDDEKVVGVGRRTRGREKRLSALGGADLGEELEDGLLKGL